MSLIQMQSNIILYKTENQNVTINVTYQSPMPEKFHMKKP